MLLTAFFSKVTKGKLSLFLALIPVLFLCGFRYNVGNDYLAYIQIFHNISQFNETYVEIGYKLLNSIFKSFEFGYFYTFFISSFLTLFIVMLVFYRYKILNYGAFFIFSFGFIFMINDQIRQGLSIALFLYSIKYIESDDFLKFFISIVLISVLFHYSAIALLPFYWIKSLRVIPNRVWALGIFFTFIFYLKGYFVSFFPKFIELIPYYNKYLTTNIHLLKPESISSGLSLLYWLMVSFFCLYFKKHLPKDNPYILLFLLGNILFFLFKDYQLTTRFTYYLVYTKIIVFPLIFKQIFSKREKYFFCLFSLFYFELQIMLSASNHGAFPYHSIFSEL